MVKDWRSSKRKDKNSRNKKKRIWVWKYDKTAKRK
jgi:hypothetical protein